MSSCCFIVFLFNATATTEIYTYGHTLSLHDSLPICLRYAETAGFVQAPVLFPATRSSFRQVVPVFRRPSDQSARRNPFQHQASRQPWRSGRRFVFPRAGRLTSQAVVRAFPAPQCPCLHSSPSPSVLFPPPIFPYSHPFP